MAWMTEEEPRRFSRMPNEPDMDALTYWITRLEPVIRAERGDEIIVVFCNRAGNEGSAMYSGTSAVIGIQEGEVKLYGILGRGEKELLVVDTNEEPHAKLVYRPEPESSDNGSESLHLDIVSQVQKPICTASAKEFREKAPHDNHGGAPQSTEHLEVRKHPNTLREGQHSRTTEYSPPFSSWRESPSIRREQESTPPLATHACKLVPKGQKLNRRLPKSDLGSSSGDAENTNNPASSAPIPTPSARRPRLVIPQSTASVISEYPAGNIVSAASETSDSSLHSVRSDESAISAQTVKPKPRPPEDSTPYPHSVASSSGYPSQQRIWGGHVTVSHVSDELSPNTAFGDLSPASPRWFWKPLDSPVRSSSTDAAQQCDPPKCTNPKPFSGPAIVPSSEKRANNKYNVSFDYANIRQISPRSPSHKVTPSKASITASGRQQTTRRQQLPHRPLSPKSRNASCSRTKDRSHSALGHCEPEGASQGTRRDEHATALSIDPAELSQRVFRGTRKPALGQQHKRSISFTASLERCIVPPSNASTLPSSVYHLSRGRQLGMSTSSATPGHTSSRRARSLDSTTARAIHGIFPEQSHRRVGHFQRGRSRGSYHNQRLAEFERFEAIVCPNCPVHGDNAARQDFNALGAAQILP